MLTFKEFLLQEGIVQTRKVGRKSIVRSRIRKGKIQRNKTFSNAPGWIIRGGKMVRMSSQEIRNRKLGSRASKYKRASKLKQTIRKRKVSLRKRGSLGL
jgi:hypothetical protein